MGTAARKARKCAGEKLLKAPKAGTPIGIRASFAAAVPGAPTTRYAGRTVGPSQKKQMKTLLLWHPELAAEVAAQHDAEQQEDVQ